MVYTTTKCTNCGFATRRRESNVPNVQLGCPILRCPRCGSLILDSIATEYEFMEKAERKKFNTKTLLLKSIPGIVLMLLLGISMIIGGCVEGGEAIAICMPIGLALIGLSVWQTVKNQRQATEEMIEQEVYESLKRIQNKKYLAILDYLYDINEIPRYYVPMEGKEDFLIKYKKFEMRESYQKNMEAFEKLLELLNVDSIIEKSEESTFISH